MARTPRIERLTSLLPVALFLLTITLSGCVTLKDPEASQEYRADQIAIVRPGQPIGQTFISRRPRLNGIQLWLQLASDVDPQRGKLAAELYHAPGDSQPLAVIPLDYSIIADSASITIPIPPQEATPDQAYYLLLKTTTGSVIVLGRGEDSYAHGALYIGGNPQDSDASFRLSYDYDGFAVLNDLREWATKARLILPLLFTLWLPGHVLLKLFLGNKKDTFDWGQRIGISLGLSLATIPVLMLWTSIYNVMWNRKALLIAISILALVYLWMSLKEIREWFGRLKKPSFRVLPTLVSFSHLDKISLSLAAVFLLSLGVRLAMVRDMAAPAWVDSVHHGMIIRLILDNGALPQTYAPYLESENASYHFGFHSTLAVFLWLSDLDIHTGMLVFGQVLNALNVFTVYLFTTTFVKNRSVGVIAALISGLFTPMPAYLTSWGRYTHLTGLLILPAAFSLIHLLLAIRNRKELNLRLGESAQNGLLLLFLPGLASAGLLLTHYRVAAFFACLLFADQLTRAISGWCDTKKHRLTTFILRVSPEIGWIAIVGSIALLLTLPWWPATIQNLFVPQFNLGQLVLTKAPIAAFSDFSWGYLTTALGKPVMVLAGLGLVWTFLSRRWFGLTLVLWTSLLFVLANLGALQLPGKGFVSNTSVEITLFLSLSVLGGYLVVNIIYHIKSVLPTWLQIPVNFLLVGAYIALALTGARALMPILNPITMLFREADDPAIAWIKENIPDDETILINSFLWGYNIYAGHDGGYWITPLGERKTLPPPALYGMGEKTKHTRWVTETNKPTLDQANDPATLHAYLQSQSIAYIYLGVRGGVLSPHDLRYSPFFSVLYNHDGAWLFQAKPVP